MQLRCGDLNSFFATGNRDRVSGPTDLERRPNIGYGVGADWNVFAGEFFETGDFDGDVVTAGNQQVRKIEGTSLRPR